MAKLDGAIIELSYSDWTSDVSSGCVTIPLSRFNGAEVKIEEMEGDDGSRTWIAACHVGAIMKYK